MHDKLDDLKSDEVRHIIGDYARDLRLIYVGLGAN
jgi:hypothetical protein